MGIQTASVFPDSTLTAREDDMAMRALYHLLLPVRLLHLHALTALPLLPPKSACTFRLGTGALRALASSLRMRAIQVVLPFFCRRTGDTAGGAPGLGPEVA